LKGKKVTTNMKKKLVCPVCGARLVDAGEGVRSEVVVLKKGNKSKNPDYYLKCHKCKNEIGVRKLG
jgi:transcription elongation factor Elf1